MAADFDDQFVRDEETTTLYAQLIATMVREEELLPLERRAVCRVIEFAAREVADAERITARMQNVADLLKEADYWARAEGAEKVTEAHIDQAIAAQIYRSDRVNERMQEAMLRETILVDTAGRGGRADQRSGRLPDGQCCIRKAVAHHGQLCAWGAARSSISSERWS